MHTSNNKKDGVSSGNWDREKLNERKDDRVMKLALCGYLGFRWISFSTDMYYWIGSATTALTDRMDLNEMNVEYMRRSKGVKPKNWIVSFVIFTGH